MSKKILISFLFLITLMSVASAQIIAVNDTPIPTFIPTAMATPKINITPTPTQLLMEKLSQTFYGEVRYADGNPASPGSIITTKDQYGTILGNYTIRELGEYGSSKPYKEKMIVSVLKNQSDRTSRTSVTFINFFVDGIRARDSVTFKIGEDTKFDILLPVTKPTPIPTTVVTTIISTPIPTIKAVETVNVSPQNVMTPTPPVSSTSTIFPGIEDIQLIIYGFIGMLVIIVGIIIIVVIQTYLMNKSNRDDSLRPDGKWR